MLEAVLLDWRCLPPPCNGHSVDTPVTQKRWKRKEKSPLVSFTSTVYVVPHCSGTAQYKPHKKDKKYRRLSLSTLICEMQQKFQSHLLKNLLSNDSRYRSKLNHLSPASSSQQIPDLPITSQSSTSITLKHFPLLPSVANTQCRANLTTGIFLRELPTVGRFVSVPATACAVEDARRTCTIMFVPTLTPNPAAYTDNTAHLKIWAVRPFLVYLSLKLKRKQLISLTQTFSYSLQKVQRKSHFRANSQKAWMLIMS